MRDPILRLVAASRAAWQAADTEVTVPPPGELTLPGVAVILGPSGSGKTAILEALAQSLPAALPRHTFPLPDHRWFATSTRWSVSSEMAAWFASFETWMTSEEKTAFETGAMSDGAETRFFRTLGSGPWVVDVTPGPDRFDLTIRPEPAAEGEEVKASVSRKHAEQHPYMVPLPSGLLIGTETTDPGDILEAGFRDVAGALRDRRRTHRIHWAVSVEDGRGRIKPYLHNHMALVEELVNALLPTWLSEQGHLKLRLLEPWEWLPEGKITRVTMRPTGSSESVDPTDLGAATRRWLSVCLTIALAQARLPLTHLEMAWDTDEDGPALTFLDTSAPNEEWDDFGPPVRRLPEEGLADTMRRWTSQLGLVLLLDEPEMHLHPSAQRQVATWIGEQSPWFDLIAITTHSPVFLGLESALASFHYVAPDHVAEIGRDVMRGLSDYEIATGFAPESWLLALRCVLLVEGQHDVEVLERFFGEDLRRGRVLVLPMRGGSKWKSIAESEFIAATGLPLVFLFDNVRLETVASADEPTGLTDEEKWAWQLLKLDRPDRRVRVLPYTDPDILAAVPPHAVARRFPHVATILADAVGDDLMSWDHLIELYRESGVRKSFKDWLLRDVLEMTKKPPAHLVLEIVNSLEPEDRPTKPITQAISTLLANSSAM